MTKSFSIACYRIEVAVEPIMEISKRSIEVQHGTKKRTITTDNVACCQKIVGFTHDYQPQLPFTLRYSTQGDGFVSLPEMWRKAAEGNEEPFQSFENASAAICRYENHGKEIERAFVPEPGCEYRFRHQVWKGFDQDSRNTHLHLLKPAKYRTLSVRLDLSKYVENQFRIDPEPKLYLHPEDTGGHEFCKQRGEGIRQEPSHVDGRGVWEWEMDYRDSPLDQGVIDLLWNVVAPVSFVPVPVGGVGIQRMGIKTVHLTNELISFYKIGAKCLASGGGRFSFKKIAEEIGTEEYTLRRQMLKVSAFFKEYFQQYGYPFSQASNDNRDRFVREYVEKWGKTPREEGFQAASDDDEDAGEGIKVFRRQARGGTYICEPVGHWAWELTRDYLYINNILTI